MDLTLAPLLQLLAQFDLLSLLRQILQPASLLLSLLIAEGLLQWRGFLTRYQIHETYLGRA